MFTISNGKINEKFKSKHNPLHTFIKGRQIPKWTSIISLRKKIHTIKTKNKTKQIIIVADEQKNIFLEKIEK